MCYGNLDPKFLTQELDARLKGVCERKDEENTEPAPGLTGWATALVARFRQKEATHV
ncbi:hypothetical protein DEA8626_00853 [Defluviimonas aquaemixtae]|uniref:Uncharacterized protein n=1 Tax=Albidovulum aquaemixtae TaxID=1542388 RepID=A0A2R8B412_9RHOB|nr:hypothetical protein [Defluviimonas aquaemixtae]SPH17335.1 hypothetical protein DEA8626_00853 [Defluviimonas aquaemixtae]